MSNQKDLETELLVIRKNYGDVLDKNEQLQRRTQEIEVELINAMNEKKELEKELQQVSSADKENTGRLFLIEKKYKAMEEEFDKTRQAYLEV